MRAKSSSKAAGCRRCRRKRLRRSEFRFPISIPPILDDLSVLENLQVALPQSLFEGRSTRDVASEMLGAVGLQRPAAARAATR